LEAGLLQRARLGLGQSSEALRDTAQAARRARLGLAAAGVAGQAVRMGQLAGGVLGAVTGASAGGRGGEGEVEAAAQ
jgi:hypothetical protein